MTPAATTPAAKTARRPARTGRTAPASAPRPRRVSGPARGAIPAPVFAPPRRVSGPTRRPASQSRNRPTLGARALGFVRTLPDHSMLDRLIRGRLWIALLGVMLVGIVAMQVEVLKLGASMGRNINRATVLQGHNEALRASVAALANEQRIETLAAKEGMVMPAPSDVAFLPTASSAVIQRAVSDIHAPAPSTFLTATTGNGAVTTAANAMSTSAGVSGAATGAIGSASTSAVGTGSGASGSGSTGSASSGSASSDTAATGSAAGTSASGATIPIAGSTSSTGN